MGTLPGFPGLPPDDYLVVVHILLLKGLKLGVPQPCKTHETKQVANPLDSFIAAGQVWIPDNSSHFG